MTPRWLMRILPCLVVVAGGCPDPIAEPRLWICGSADCVDDALADRGESTAEHRCDDLADVVEGSGFYALHVVPNPIVLPDGALGTLTVDTVCGERSLSLTYGDTPNAKGRVAVIPLLGTSELACGAAIQASLFDRVDTCVRPLSNDPTACALLRDGCETAASASSGGSTTTMGGEPPDTDSGMSTGSGMSTSRTGSAR